MKWNHPFQLLEQGESHRLYGCGTKRARLDFFQHVLRVAIYEEGAYLFPTFPICPGETRMDRHGRNRLSTDGFTPSVQKEDVLIDGVSIQINPQNFLLSYKVDGKTLFQDRPTMAYNLGGELGRGSYHYLSREPNERIYGLGDKTGSVNKNKRRFRMETFDALGFDANPSDPLYKQVLFYMCSNGVGSYGIFYDTYSNGEMDFGCEINNYYPGYKYAHFDEDVLVYYVFFGTPSEILHHFLYAIGKAALPTKWSFRYCGSTMAYTDAPNAEEHSQFIAKNHCDLRGKRCVYLWIKGKRERRFGR